LKRLFITAGQPSDSPVLRRRTRIRRAQNGINLQKSEPKTDFLQQMRLTQWILAARSDRALRCQRRGHPCRHVGNGLFMSNNGHELGLALRAASIALSVSGAGCASIDRMKPSQSGKQKQVK